MKISAVIVTFNRRNYIRRAVDSVLAQTTSVAEIIVVDDVRSTDRIEDAVAEWYGSQVRVVKQDGGLSGARRRGVQEARGEWVAFLDSDDEWEPGRTAELSRAADCVPADVAWIFGDMRVATDNGTSTTLFGEHGLRVTGNPQIFEDSLSVQYPFQFGLLQGSLIRRHALLEVDCFNEGLQSSEDLLVGFQIACRYRFAAIPSIVGTYYLTSDLASTSASVAGVFGPDYYRARMLCFALVINAGHRKPWNKLYAAEARGLCKVMSAKGSISRSLAWGQFRFGGVSAKGIGFCLAAMFGSKGLDVWESIGSFWRNRRQAKEQSENVGIRGWAQSAEAASTRRISS